MTFVDTSAWYALVVPDDANHERAHEWLKTYPGRLITTDYVIDETLTLLRSRGQRDDAIDWGTTMFGPNTPAFVHFLQSKSIDDAWNVFRKFDDKDWSFTDCTSKVVIDQLGIRTAFAFDHHFRQFGTVAVVP